MLTPWKDYQRIYNQLVVDHEDALTNFTIKEDDEIVNNALNYFKEQSDVAVYPAKSYAVAIVYATFISEYYGVDLRSVLDDPDLFLGTDSYFVRYSADPDTYEAILEGLQSMPDWRVSGWAPKSFKYAFLECTEDGIEEVVKNLYQSKDQ
jgi:hypothetical protein